MSQSIVGLDLGTYSIKIVELEKDFRNFSFLRAFEARIPLDPKIPYYDAMTTVLLEQFSAEGLDHKTVICGYPGHQCSIRVLSLPPTDRSKLEKMIPYEIESQIPLELDEIHHDWEILDTGKNDVSSEPGQASILAVSVVRNQFSQFLNTLSALNIDPRDATLDTLVLSYLKDIEPQAEPGAVAFMDCGHSKTNICVLLMGKPIYTRSIGIAGREITRALETDFSLDFLEAETLKQTDGILIMRGGPGVKPEAEKISQSIRRVVDDLTAQIRQTLVNCAENHGINVAQFYLCGGSAKLKNLDQYLTQSVGIPFKKTNFLSAYNTGEFSDEHSYSLQTALALALRGVHAKPNSMINLRKGEFKPKRNFQKVPSFVGKSISLLGILFLAFFLNFIVKSIILHTQTKSMERKIETEVKKVIPTYTFRGARHALSSLQNQVQGSGSGSASLAKLSAGQSPMITLKDISESITQNVPLTLEEIKIDLDRVRLQGTTNSRESITKIRDQLESLPQFSKVSENRVQKSGNGYLFDLNIQIVAEKET